MHKIKRVLSHLGHYGQKVFLALVLLCVFIHPAHADIVDSFNLAPFVPLVLDTMMNIATSLYKFFVGNGTGLIYILIYAFAGFYIAMYLIKMYLPSDWLSFFGFSGGGEIWSGNTTGFSIAENVLKPCLRVVIAAVVLLQIKPIYVTEWLVNPFLEFGSIYTESILSSVTNNSVVNIDAPKCPASIADSGWISERSCNFLVQPVHIISQENNRIIKYGFKFVISGLSSLVASWIPRGGEGILNIITGIMLIVAFVSSNLFMALLIIQGIFDFCFALIMYPFNVLGWVARKSDKWFDVLPAFDQIIDALKKLVIIMIACAFILCINVAVVRALFNWSSAPFVDVANASVPTITNTGMNFGQHSMLWISSILTFFLMQNIFKMTRERLDTYTKGASKSLYNNVTSDAKVVWKKIKATPDTIKTIVQGKNKVSGGK